MSGSDRTKNRIPVQVSRWAISQHYSGREDLRIPADSVTRTHQLFLEINLGLANPQIDAQASLSLVAWDFRPATGWMSQGVPG
jgi:hypothetical protein